MGSAASIPRGKLPGIPGSRLRKRQRPQVRLARDPVLQPRYAASETRGRPILTPLSWCAHGGLVLEYRQRTGCNIDPGWNTAPMKVSGLEGTMMARAPMECRERELLLQVARDFMPEFRLGPPKASRSERRQEIW
jgi:hypothetical protein